MLFPTSVRFIESHLPSLSSAMALSGLQKQVLSLYRQCLRTAGSKQGQQSNVIALYCRQQFLQNKKIDHKNVQLIEHLLRQGKRQLDLVNDSHVTNVHMR